MNKERFERLVARAVETLPKEFLDRLENVAVVVENYPTHTQLARTGLRHDQTLLGLYEGVPLTKPGRHRSAVPPAKITLFQKPIESRCRDDAEINAEIQRVVRHEIAHHFGTDEATLKQIEKAKARRKQKAS